MEFRNTVKGRIRLFPPVDFWAIFLRKSLDSWGITPPCTKFGCSLDQQPCSQYDHSRAQQGK